jgi:hypothetical protein
VGLFDGQNQGQRVNAVTMTEQHAELLITKVIEGVTKQNDSTLMENYRRLVTVEIELTQARAEMARLSGELAARDAHIVRLTGFIASMNPSMTQSPPSFPDRVAASAPMPPLATRMPDPSFQAADWVASPASS